MKIELELNEFTTSQTARLLALISELKYNKNDNILKKIDDLIIETDDNLAFCSSTNDLYEIYKLFYNNVIEYMKNYFETEHFKQSEL